MSVTIFFCYAREDEALLNRLKTHLRPLQRLGLIDVWYDRNISAGAEWEPEIIKHLNAAQVILLLVSPDFMDSDYAYGIEMKRALERHGKGEARVIPIILCPVYWHEGPLGNLQALPKDGKPVTHPDWHRPDNALYDITQGIREVVRQLTDKQVSPSSVAVSVTPEEKQHETASVSSISAPVEQIGDISWQQPFSSPNMPKKEVGRRLQTARMKRELTQYQLAERVGVSVDSVRRWERGATIPQVSVRPRLCEVLRMNLEELEFLLTSN